MPAEYREPPTRFRISRNNGHCRGLFGHDGTDPDGGLVCFLASEGNQQFRNSVHCVRISQDGLVYVCNHRNNRIHVFTKQGKFVKEFFLRKETLGNGSIWAPTFSRDNNQKYLLVAGARKS